MKILIFLFIYLIILTNIFGINSGNNRCSYQYNLYLSGETIIPYVPSDSSHDLINAFFRGENPTTACLLAE